MARLRFDGDAFVLTGNSGAATSGRIQKKEELDELVVHLNILAEPNVELEMQINNHVAFKSGWEVSSQRVESFFKRCVLLTV